MYVPVPCRSVMGYRSHWPVPFRGINGNMSPPWVGTSWEDYCLNSQDGCFFSRKLLHNGDCFLLERITVCFLYDMVTWYIFLQMVVFFFHCHMLVFQGFFHMMIFDIWSVKKNSCWLPNRFAMNIARSKNPIIHHTQHITEKKKHPAIIGWSLKLPNKISSLQGICPTEVNNIHNNLPQTCHMSYQISFQLTSWGLVVFLDPLNL